MKIVSISKVIKLLEKGGDNWKQLGRGNDPSIEIMEEVNWGEAQ